MDGLGQSKLIYEFKGDSTLGLSLIFTLPTNESITANIDGTYVFKDDKLSVTMSDVRLSEIPPSVRTMEKQIREQAQAQLGKAAEYDVKFEGPDSVELKSGDKTMKLTRIRS